MLIATANARLTRSKTGVLKGALHTNGGTLVFNGRTHEQFVDLFQAIGSEVILTGSGEALFGVNHSRRFRLPHVEPQPHEGE